MERNSGILCASVCKKERDGKRVGEDQHRRSKKKSEKEMLTNPYCKLELNLYRRAKCSHFLLCQLFCSLCVCVLLMGGLALVASLEVAHSHTHACMAKLC